MDDVRSIIDSAPELDKGLAGELVTLVRSHTSVAAMISFAQYRVSEKVREFINVDLHDVVTAAALQGEIRALNNLINGIVLLMEEAEKPEEKEEEDEKVLAEDHDDDSTVGNSVR